MSQQTLRVEKTLTTKAELISWLGDLGTDITTGKIIKFELASSVISAAAGVTITGVFTRPAPTDLATSVENAPE